MKDPAFLFYPGDWTMGTINFTRHEKGAYIDLLMAQFSIGHLCIEDVKIILAIDFDLWEKKLAKKFKIDADGKYFNEKLEGEIIKRKNFTGSRRKNLLGDKKELTHISDHMNDHMENENENKKENRIKRENIFKEEVFSFSEKYSKEMLQKFFNYWSEPNKSGTKMRFELQPTFEISRRLVTWANKSFNKTTNNGRKDFI